MSVPSQSYDDYYNEESFEELASEIDNMTETEAVSEEETYNDDFSEEEYEEIDDEATDVPSDGSETNAELRSFKMLDLESQVTERTLRAENDRRHTEMTEVEDDANLEFEVEDDDNLEFEEENYANLELEGEDDANLEFEVEDDSNLEFEGEDDANLEFEVEDDANLEFEAEDAGYRDTEEEDYAEYQVEQEEAAYEDVEMTQVDDADLQEEFMGSEDETGETSTMSTVKEREKYKQKDHGEASGVNEDYNELDDGEQIKEEYFSKQHNSQNARKNGGMEKQFQNELNPISDKKSIKESQTNPCTDNRNEQQFPADGRGYSTVRHRVKPSYSDSRQIEQSSSDETYLDDESEHNLGSDTNRTDYSKYSECTLVNQSSEFYDSESLGSSRLSHKDKEYSKKIYSKFIKAHQSVQSNREEPKDESEYGEMASKSRSKSRRTDNKSNASGSFKSVKMEESNWAHTEMSVERKVDSSSRRKNGFHNAEDGIMKSSNLKHHKLQQQRFEETSDDAMSYITKNSDVSHKSKSSNKPFRSKLPQPRFENGLSLSQLSKIVTIDKHEFCEPISEDSRTYNKEKSNGYAKETHAKRIKSKQLRSERGSSVHSSQYDSNYSNEETESRQSGTLYGEASERSNLPKYLLNNQTMYAKLPKEKSKKMNFKSNINLRAMEHEMHYGQRHEDGSGDAGNYHSLKQRQSQVRYPNEHEEYMSDATEATKGGRNYSKSHAEYSNEMNASEGRKHRTKMFSMQQTMTKALNPKTTKSESFLNHSENLMMMNETGYYQANNEQMSYYEDGSGDASRCLKSPRYKQAQQIRQSRYEEEEATHVEHDWNNNDRHNAHIFVDPLDLQSDDVDDDKNDAESKLSMEQTNTVHFKKLSQNPKSLSRPMTTTSHKTSGRNSGRKSFSHTNEQVRDIERQNQILARKIMSTKSTVTPSPKKLAASKSKTSMVSTNATPTSAAIERQTKQRQIEAENVMNRKKMSAISSRRPVYK